MALHVRDRAGLPAALARCGERFVALARPAEAQVFVSSRADIARAVGAHGVQLSGADLAPDDARRVLGAGLIGRSVHSSDEARRARDEGADFVMLGHVFETPSHPDRPAIGLEPVTRVARDGIAVVAIGGITAGNVSRARDAGAWGVAAIRALWHAGDPAAAARELLAPWLESTEAT